MKFVITVVQDYDSDRLLRAVTAAGFRATRISSTGGFLRMGNATIFMAVKNERVDEAIRLIREHCKSRVEVKVDTTSAEFQEWYAAGIHEVTVGGGVVFTMPIDRMVRIMPDGRYE